VLQCCSDAAAAPVLLCCSFDVLLRLIAALLHV